MDRMFPLSGKGNLIDVNQNQDALLKGAKEHLVLPLHNTAKLAMLGPAISNKIWDKSTIGKSLIEQANLINGKSGLEDKVVSGDYYFNIKGEFLRRDNKKTNMVYIINYNGVATQLKDFHFTKATAQALANIMKYFGIDAGEKVNTLRLGEFSIANKQVVKGVNLPEIKSWYNEGMTASVLSGDVMNYNEKQNTVTVSLFNGYVQSVLNDANNIKSTIKHEFKHKSRKGSEDGFEHLKIYMEQISDPIFKDTTPDFKDLIYTNIEDYVNSAIYYYDEELSEAQLEGIHNEGRRLKKVFKAKGVKFKRD